MLNSQVSDKALDGGLGVQWKTNGHFQSPTQMTAVTPKHSGSGSWALLTGTPLLGFCSYLL